MVLQGLSNVVSFIFVLERPDVHKGPVQGPTFHSRVRRKDDSHLLVDESY